MSFVFACVVLSFVSLATALAASDSYPFVLDVWNDKDERIQCMASLVTPKCAITSAHCVFTVEPADLRVYTAKQGNPKAGEGHVESFAWHSDFKIRSATAEINNLDVAVMILKEPMSAEQAKPVTIDYNTHSEAGNAITTFSWKREPLILEVHNGTVDTIENCKWTLPLLLQKNIFCAAIPLGAGTSGSPVINNVGKQVGIASYGKRHQQDNNSSTYFTEFTDDKLKEFLQNVLTKSC